MNQQQAKIMTRLVNPVTTKVSVTNSGFILVERKQDAEPILDDNHLKRSNQAPIGGRFKDPMTCVAHIPNVLIEQWMDEGLNVFDSDQQKELHSKLNDRDFRKLRTVEGRI